jgi:gas vesicle protein
MASKLLLGFGVGLLVGVLLAPEKGSETRKKIAQSGSDLKDKFNDFIDSLHEKIHAAKDEAENFADRAKHEARDLARETNPSWSM